MKDSIKLGRIITGSARRDAIHIALAPVVAAEGLSPGDHVALDDTGKALAFGDPIGIVDPFLTQSVNKGETFWLMLYQGTITGLRHEWIHPAFGPEEKAACDKADAEQWLRAYAAKHCYYDGDNAYDVFMEHAKDDTIFYHGDDCHSYDDVESAHELFANLEIVLGRPFRRDDLTFSCSC